MGENTQTDDDYTLEGLGIVNTVSYNSHELHCVEGRARKVGDILEALTVLQIIADRILLERACAGNNPSPRERDLDEFVKNNYILGGVLNGIGILVGDAQDALIRTLDPLRVGVTRAKNQMEA